MNNREYHADCFYGTSTPKKTKNSHTGWIIAASLFVIAACSLNIVMTLTRPMPDAPGRLLPEQGGTAQTEASAATEQQDDAAIVVAAGDCGTCSVPTLCLGGSGRTASSADEILELVSPSLCTVTVGFAERTAVCTGVIITSDGYLLAACGELQEALDIQIEADTLTCRACWIGSDAQTGLALLKPEIGEPDFTPVVFAGAADAAVGDAVLAVSGSGEISQGEITAVGENELSVSASALQAGAVLVDRHGDVLGLAPDASDGQDSTSVIASDALPAALARILDANPAAQLWLSCDVGEIPALFIKYYHYPGTLWFREQPGVALSEAGLCEHDIILEADGKAVATVEDLNAAIAAHSVGDTIELTIYRDGKTYTAALPVYGR